MATSKEYDVIIIGSDVTGAGTARDCALRDWQGSVRVVVGSGGNVEQATDYLSGGVPLTSMPLFTSDSHLHTGKPWQPFGGLCWYDNAARWYDPTTCAFTTPDPLADKYPHLSPFAHCGGNPIRFTDPTGMYEVENLESNNSSVTVVVPSKRDEVIEKDYIIAKNRKLPIMIVDDVEDFANALKYASSTGNDTQIYSINSHGSPGNFRIGEQEAKDLTDFKPLKDGLKNKYVFIGACEVAKDEGNTNDITSRFAGDTNSITITSVHKVPNCYEYDGSHELNDLNYSPSMGQFAEGNEFKISYKGKTSMSIYDFSISSRFGASWLNSDGTRVWWKR